MVWDLGKAMRKKEEFESARLMDFDFRQRARATRLLARDLGLDETRLVRELAVRDDNAILELVARESGRDLRDISVDHAAVSPSRGES